MLPDNIEKKLVHEALGASDKGFGVGLKQSKERVGCVMKDLGIQNRFRGNRHAVGNKWLAGVKRRNPEITLHRPQKVTTVRTQMMNRVVVGKYFEDLQLLIQAKKNKLIPA